VALEAAAHSLPGVAADLEGIREAVKPGMTGYLLKSRDSDIWVSQLNNLLYIPEKLRELGQKARLTVKNENTWEQTVDHYLEIFESITGKREKTK